MIEAQIVYSPLVSGRVIRLEPRIMLRHIMQKQSWDCVVTCAAIVSNTTYSDACNACGDMLPDRPVFAKETRKILRAVTGCTWLGPLPSFSARLRGFRRPATRLILIEKPRFLPRWKPVRHAILISEFMAYDPEYADPSKLGDYERRNWRVNSYYMPLNAAILHRKQKENAKSVSPLWNDILKT